MPGRLKTYLELLSWSILLVSVFWTAEFLFTAIRKLIIPDVYFHSIHYPELIVIYGVLFSILALILNFAKKRFLKHADSQKFPESFSFASFLIILFYFLTIFNFRIAISGLSVDFQTVHKIDPRIIIGNLIIIAGTAVLFRLIRKLTAGIINALPRLELVTLGYLLFVAVLYNLVMKVDLNRHFYSFPRQIQPEAQTQSSPPNIFIAIVDNLRADYAGCYGDTLGLTPNIDRIASEGALFLNHYSTSSWTTPGFVSIYTSLDPHRVLLTEDRPEISHSLEGKYFFYPVNKIKPETPAVTSIYKNAGYQVSTFQANYQAGERFNFNLHNDFHLSCYNRTRDANLLFVIFSGVESVAKSIINIDQESHSPVQNKSAKHYCAYGDKLVNYSFGLIDQSRRRPFLNIVNFMDVHEYSKRYPAVHNLDLIKSVYPIEYLRVSYAANTVYDDEQIGRIYRQLEDRNLLDNTILVIMSDHGEQFGEHGAVGEHGFSVYNEEIKVPFIVRYPSKIPAGQIFSDPGSNLDLLPTLLSLCDLDAGSYEFEGIDLFNSAPQERSLFAGMTLYTKDKNALIQGDNKVIYNSYDGSLEFYNLADDPDELNPASPDSSETGLKMKTHLEAWIDEITTCREDLAEELAGEGDAGIDANELKSIGYIK